MIDFSRYYKKPRVHLGVYFEPYVILYKYRAMALCLFLYVIYLDYNLQPALVYLLSFISLSR